MELHVYVPQSDLSREELKARLREVAVEQGLTGLRGNGSFGELILAIAKGDLVLRKPVVTGRPD